MDITTGARRNGKTAAMHDAVNKRIAAGEHVHIVTRLGIRCANGPDECHARRQPAETTR